MERAQGRLLGGPHGEGRAADDVGNPAVDGFVELLGGHDLVHEAELVGALGGHVATGEHVPHHRLKRSLAWEAVDAHGPGNEPYLRLSEAETGVLGGDDDVGGEGHLEAAAEGVAVHPRDDRLEQIEAAGEAAETGARPGDPGPLGGGQARHLGRELEVVAGAEGASALAREDGDPEVVVGGKVVPDLVELEVGVDVERVHDLRAGDGDVGDRALLLVAAEFHGCDLRRCPRHSTGRLPTAPPTPR